MKRFRHRPPTTRSRLRSRRIVGSGGTHARWRRDGRELFYVALDGTLMGTPITFTNTETVTAGVPVALFQT